MIGQLLAGRYELQDVAGSGGMSSVYRARDTVLERTVAIKILHEHYSDDPEYVERFRREARALAQLNHPNIVTVIDRGEYEGRQFIVFEHVEGENLKELIDREGQLPVDQALALVHQVARGLAFAHEHGVVHRDVKPHNVLIDADGVAKVTDFGIARSIEPADGLTETGTLLGTSEYIAPEQASGRRVDERSDQYSLATVLYELLTGSPPVHGRQLHGRGDEAHPGAGAQRARLPPGRLAAARRDRLARDGEAARGSLPDHRGDDGGPRGRARRHRRRPCSRPWSRRRTTGRRRAFRSRGRFRLRSSARGSAFRSRFSSGSSSSGWRRS